MSYHHSDVYQRLVRKTALGRAKPMERRSFLKFTGMGGLVLACAEGASEGAQEQLGALTGDGPMGGSGSGGTPGAAGAMGGQPGAGGNAGVSEDGPTADSLDGAGGQAGSESQNQPELPPVNYTELSVAVHIGDDDGVTFIIGQSEMGQGVLTALSMMLAEELEVDWTKVRAEHPSNFRDFPGWATFASASVAGAVQANLRAVGAAAREMLVAAAAEVLEVPVGQLRAEQGEVVHDATDRRVGYGQLVDLAATLPEPQTPTLLTDLPDRPRRVWGTGRAQVHARQKASGTAQYTLDVQVPNMLVGLVARSPSVGGSVQSFDASAAFAVPGVRDVVEISSGIAVLADHYWAALKGREALVVQWDGGPNAEMSNATLTAAYAAALPGGNEVESFGVPEQVFTDSPAERQLDVNYQLPYLAHAPMEPLNAVADVQPNAVQLWAGTQAPGFFIQAVSALTGVDANNITLTVPFLGGGFGLRGTSDFILEAVEASQAVGRPVKLVYAREDDMRGANYRPMNYHRLRGSVDALGRVNSWIHNISVQGIFGGFATEGAADAFPYNIENFAVTWADPGQGVPVFTWRSVGASQNGFVVQSFIDELAALGGQDPLEARLQMLADSADPDAARHAAALQNVADRSGWDQPAPPGRARGIAVHQTFGTIVAQVAEVSLDAGRVRVHRVWAAVDCGEAINPRGVEAQCEGSIIFGMSAALYGKIDLEGGAPVQGNFDTYPLVRISEAPEISVEILSSGKQTTGMGEPGVPPIAPAICNALFQLTGQRIRQLPIVDFLET